MSDRPLWIQVVENQVKEVWDCNPPGDVSSWIPSGWRKAVEVHPTLVPNREIETAHTFDLTVDPAQIVWGKRELTFDERYGSIESIIKGKFQQFNQMQLMALNTGGTFDPVAIADKHAEMDDKLAELAKAKTHEDLDKFL